MLLDKLAGVTRTATGGSPTQTPNITPGSMILSNFGSGTMNASYASMLVYDHDLSYWEVQNLYSALKLKMLERGISLQ